METTTNQQLAPELKDFADEVQKGLSAMPKSLSSRFIYDDEGSRLFEQIMKLDEYYPTACEYEILQKHGRELASIAGTEPFNLVELGAGNGEKTILLLQHFENAGKPFTYYPLDISSLAIDIIEKKLQREMPSVTTHGITAEYFDGLQWLRENSHQRNIVLFMGGNIGNFPPVRLNSFLHDLHDSLNKGDILILGCDLVKDYHTILRAYNDAQGVTKQFQLNLLHRINRELGGNFNSEQFAYYPIYNPGKSAIESYLVSLQAQDVRVEALGQTFSFAAHEPIHTEYSFKFTTQKLEQIAASTGFTVKEHLFDSRRYFVDSVWEVG